MADEIEELVSEDVQCMSHDIRESMIIKANEKHALPCRLQSNCTPPPSSYGEHCSQDHYRYCNIREPEQCPTW